MPSREDAEDVFQEGFVKVFRDLKQYDAKRAKLKTWMNRVFINTALEHLRKRKNVFETIELSGVYDLHVADDGVFSSLGLQELTKLVQELPTGYRVVFNMYVVEGYAHKEIAEQLNISVNTSKSQLFKAKAILRKKVKQAYAVAPMRYEKGELQR